jgi:hypothetical protein
MEVEDIAVITIIAYRGIRSIASHILKPRH